MNSIQLRIFLLLDVLLATTICTAFGSVTSREDVVRISEVIARDDGGEWANLDWFYNQSTYTITINGTGNMKYGSSYPWRSHRDVVQNVIIEEGVTSIESCAFASFPALRNVTIPESVESIGHECFVNCINLSSVVIPPKVTSIQYSCFSGCSKLETITIPLSVETIGNRVFRDCESLISVDIPSEVTSIGEEAFLNCINLKNITISSKVSSVGKDAFGNCPNLFSIEVNESNSDYSSEGGVLFNYNKSTLIRYPCERNTTYGIPDSVTDIASRAFDFCTKMTSVTFPPGLSSIGASAFYNCSSLTSLNIPDTVTSIGSHAFAYCESATNVTIPSGLSYINPNSFQRCISLTSVVIPYGVTLIDYNAFVECFSLKSVVIPSSVRTLGDYVFYNCYNLTSITLPESITKTGQYLFSNCISLSSVELLSKISTIESNTFAYCVSLTSIKIPSSVTIIKQSAFLGCASLHKITIPSSVTKIEQNAFQQNLNLTVLAYLGKNDPGNSINAFPSVSSLKFICVPDDYHPSSFCGFNTLCKSSQCEDAVNNQCYDILDCADGSNITMQKKSTAEEWEKQVHGCAEYKCYNESGNSLKSKCSNEENGDKWICMNDECVNSDELYESEWVAEIEFDDTRLDTINVAEVIQVLNKITGVEIDNSSIGIKIDEKAQVTRIIIGFSNKQTANLVVAAVNDIRRGEECNEGILCRTRAARIVPNAQHMSKANQFYEASSYILTFLVLVFIPIIHQG